MNAKLLIPFIAAALFSLSAHALDCSGGANGGMDATGNQCNDAPAVAAVDSSAYAALPSARVPTVETNQAGSYRKSAVKPIAATRPTSASVRIKHG